MQKFQFVKVDSVLAKYHRDFKGLGLDEGDGIEWIGEALGFVKQVGACEEAIIFAEVKDYQVVIPNGMHYIIQIARNNQWVKEDPVSCTPAAIVTNLQQDTNCDECNKGWTDNMVPIDCEGAIMGDFEVAYYRPYFDLQYEYGQWAQSSYCRTHYSPVRLADHSFLNSLVCTVPEAEGLYNNNRGEDEYTIVQDYLRFSFKEGFVAIACVRQKTDPETGYPMIPDDESARAAITYYMVWKVKQREWIVLGREGTERQAKSMQLEWEKYVKQFRSKAKMPSGPDAWQNLMEQSNYLLPRRNRHYGFFGKLSTQEPRPYNQRRY